MLDEILLTKISYDTDIPEWKLRHTPKFWDYWLDYLSSTDDDFTMAEVFDFTMEMVFNGEFDNKESN